MKKKIISMLAAFMVVMTVAVPLTTDYSHAFTIRKKMPGFSSKVGKKYYYTNKNIYYAAGYAPTLRKRSNGLYCRGNCTWYAYSRASELLGSNLNTAFKYNAGQWWSTNKSGNYYAYGSKPKAGAIACYSAYGSSVGHVAIVEKVVNGKAYVSESGWSQSYYKPTSASSLSFHYGSPWVTSSRLQGYIYVLDNNDKKGKSVNYSVKITAKDLNMRVGPGSGYASKGYVKPGTYKLSRTYNGWGKLKKNGYWVSLIYTTKVTSETTTSNDSKTTSKKSTTTKKTTTTTKKTTTSTKKSTTSTATFKVKVTATDLNMRTGAGSKYKSKGTVKKGKTYTIKKTKGNWGQLKSNGYWIHLSYTKLISSSYKVKITTTDLNMRTGPGTKYKSKGFAKKGTYEIKALKNGWGQLKKNGYWIKLSYAKKV